MVLHNQLNIQFPCMLNIHNCTNSAIACSSDMSRSRVINFILRKFAQDHTERISVLGHFLYRPCQSSLVSVLPTPQADIFPAMSFVLGQ